MPRLTVEQLLKDKSEFLELYVLQGGTGLRKIIPSNQITRPGLALAGYTERFSYSRTLILGKTEISYLNSLSKKELEKHLNHFFSFDIPLIVITKALEPPQVLLRKADLNNVPVLQTNLTTTEFIIRISSYLDNLFAPRTSIHGTLVDVYGVGMLYTGKSGIGKSECALDLVERGHRMVADDVVTIIKKAPDVIMGVADERIGHHMEIRGVGIIDIEKLFGIRSVRLQKRIEVEVRLEQWDDSMEYDRLGIEEKYTTILGVEIPVVTIPVSPGKNITVISEVISMNHMLKVYGEKPAEKFVQRLSEALTRRKLTTEYLEADME
ncbi:MAG: HPr(Ser) kinase/phosphatase [candidate division Zixibacteria bacterium 4484_95]|nr:MAG: HPr(Ser) kinase/phosphatase [candidate division Zixibacteria bacterium 4484_95]RKX20373.1 MAG: HPr(Ser) kinase/phosphatase [candidate division Zixibacteria bacterium]